MGTITFEVHPIIPTSSRIHACKHFKSIFDLFAFDFSLHILLLNISCMGLLEREKNYPMIFDIHILLCQSIQVSYYDCWPTMVRLLFMPFSQDFLVFPVKKSDMHVKFKRQLNRTHHKHEPQSSLA